jgi:hypothetical protein
MWWWFRGTRGRKAARREFRPALEGRRLEVRVVPSHAKAVFVENQYLLTHPQPGNAFRLGKPPQLQGSKAFDFSGGPVFNQGYTKINTIRGGQGVLIAQPDGSRFRVTLQIADTQFDGGLSAETGGSGTGVIPAAVVQPNGTVRAYAMPGGRVGLIVDGTTLNMQLVIDPLPVTQRKGYAHSFGYLETGRTHVLNVGSINVTSGNLNAILGFHDVDLYGPLIIGGTGKVDRIALNSLQPGAAIGVGGTLNTLDIANGANLTSGVGISVGGDLNLLNVGNDLNLTNGASLRVGRFIGLSPQPPKGTSTGSNILSLNQSLIGTGTSTLTPSISTYIQGNVNVGAGSVFSITSGVANSSIVGASTTGGSPTPILINGSLNVVSGNQIQIPNLQAGTTFFTQNPFTGALVANNLVARNGIFVNGVPITTS